MAGPFPPDPHRQSPLNGCRSTTPRNDESALRLGASGSTPMGPRSHPKSGVSFVLWSITQRPSPAVRSSSERFPDARHDGPAGSWRSSSQCSLRPRAVFDTSERLVGPASRADRGIEREKPSVSLGDIRDDRGVPAVCRGNGYVECGAAHQRARHRPGCRARSARSGVRGTARSGSRGLHGHALRSPPSRRRRTAARGMSRMRCSACIGCPGAAWSCARPPNQCGCGL